MQMLEKSYILQLSLWTGGAILACALLAGLLCLKLLTRKLNSLASAMDTFRRGELSAQRDVMSPSEDRPVTAKRADEIDTLETAFVQMAALIRQQVRQLKETDQLRRELVANVSHDLRTPVTSLQGYLETLMLKEGALSSQERQRYLEIAAAQSKRLGDLIAELFELAKLNSQEMKPRVESFALGELVQDVVQKFRFRVEAKQMTLQAKLGEDLPFVSADIGLIERVLENLIENALRYTPHGGRITVTLSRMDEKILTRVTDTGCGIPPEDLPHVFDRYYQVGKTHQKDETGAGLGLAITKRILELHGSTIEVQSGINQETTFSFHLAVALPGVIQGATTTVEYSPRR